MRLFPLFQKSRARKPAPQSPDWSTGYHIRDWADLPVHHPRTQRDGR